MRGGFSQDVQGIIPVYPASADPLVWVMLYLVYSHVFGLDAAESKNVWWIMSLCVRG